MGVTERIGEEYKQWQRGEIVYISAPTGSGKTEFILDTLLNYAIENNRAILYLVNRQILKAQLLERINSKQNQRVHNGKYVDVKNCIFVETYQALENINAINQNYFYIVADECHYGYCDSLFNPNTFLSYNLIISAIETCRIFISATMENMKNYIDMHIPDYKNMYQSNIFRFTRWKTWSYEIKAEYNHINLKCVNDMGELEQIIENEKGNKWLIFTDKKEKGKELQKNLVVNSSIVYRMRMD